MLQIIGLVVLEILMSRRYFLKIINFDFKTKKKE